MAVVELAVLVLGLFGVLIFCQ